MALEIINRKIVGTIDNLEEKLSGKLPVTREELLVLVNSWGRLGNFDAKASNNQMLMIDKCDSKECYDLSKLDTREITDMSSVFRTSNFNGYISNWNTSNVTNMSYMFTSAKSFNQPLDRWDTSKVTNMSYMFYAANVFNQDINNWNISNVINMNYMFTSAKSFNQPINFDTSKATNMSYMFNDAKSFRDKYNSGEPLPNYTNEIKDWLIKNRDKINEIDIKDKYGNQIDGFFTNITNLTTQRQQAF